MISEVLSFFRSTYGGLSKIVIGAAILVFAGWFIWGQTSTVQKAKTISPDWTQETVQINDNITFTDSDGEQEDVEKPEDVEEVEQSITIDSSSVDSTRRLFVESRDPWFPEITGKPNARVRGLSGPDVEGITVTNQTTSLLGLDLGAVMIGPTYSLGGSVNGTLAYTPLRFWAFRFGASGNYSIQREFSIQAAANVQVKENLYLSASVTPDVVLGGEDKQLTVGLLYRF